jgi:addiction module HigA family antidote
LVSTRYRSLRGRAHPWARHTGSNLPAKQKGRDVAEEKAQEDAISRVSTNKHLFKNPHPGEILTDELLKPMRLSRKALARALGMPPCRINEIVRSKRAMTAETDLRLARYFNMSEGFFIGLQSDFELMERERGIAAS